MTDKHGQGKLDYTLLPGNGLEDVVRVLEFGARKYGRENWRTAPDLRRRYLAATMRHLFAMSEGVADDIGSGLPHAAHAACYLLFILENRKVGEGQN